MTRKQRCLWILLASLTSVSIAYATEFRQSTKLSPSDYLLHSREEQKDPVFDSYKTIELGANIGVGSDCGRINFTSTLRASLKNILDTKYFGDMGKNILAGSPMLLTCYFSPTWCAILKHSQINANWMSQMRLNQCSLIDKYVDSRVEDFYQERQGCVRKEIDKNGGNLEQAMESCNGNRLWESDLANWAGSKDGEKSATNKLIDSSAKWAGMESGDAKRTIDLIKGFVGDTVVSKGNIHIEYGPRQNALTPRTYLQSLEKFTYDTLCKKIVKKAENGSHSHSIDRLITDDDLRSISPGVEQFLVDRQTIRALIYMSPKQRIAACQKLSDAVAMTIFSTDINRSLDVLTTLSQNPNLPENRKQEIERKRKGLKESIEMTVTLQKQRSDPLNTVLAQINEEGSKLQSEAFKEELDSDSASRSNERLNSDLMNCADSVMCVTSSGGN